MKNFFKNYTSNTIAGSANQFIFVIIAVMIQPNTDLKTADLKTALMAGPLWVISVASAPTHTIG